MKFSNYRLYKTKLRKEFNYSCVYCEVREPELGGAQSFHVDHYKPKSKFPHLISTYSNLLYTCRNCNQSKGDYWPKYWQKLLNQIVLNPRADKIDTHIDKSNFSWEGKTLQGDWTITRLKLNSPAKILQRKKRKKIEEIIALFEKERKDLQQLKTNNQSNMKFNLEEPQQKIDRLTSNINTLRQQITGPMD